MLRSGYLGKLPQRFASDDQWRGHISAEEEWLMDVIIERINRGIDGEVYDGG